MFDLDLILPAATLGISRLSETPGHLHLVFDRNTNDKASVFAGSIFSLAALSGYDTAFHRREELCLSGEVFLVSSNIVYQQPGFADLFTKSRITEDLTLSKRANHKIRIQVKVYNNLNGKRCASFEGVYVVKTAGL
jgi:thioesterase domain-containing protein